MTVFHYIPTKTELHPPRAFALACMGWKGGRPDAETLSLLERAEAAIAKEADPRVCYALLPIQKDAGRMMLDGKEICSESLSRLLEGCDACIVFAATLGVSVDRAISIRALSSPAEALAMDAAANAYIEAVCDSFCEAKTAEYGNLTMRFSPGYGDLALEEQKFFLELLDTSRRIGLSLTAACMMAPVKSVSAIVGICGK